MKVIDIQFRRDAAYLAVECGDDLHDLLEQTWSGKVFWNNSGDRDLVIRGDRENDLYRLDLLAQETERPLCISSHIIGALRLLLRA